MKNLDTIKFILIMCGFYNNMRFDSWRCEDDITCWWYEWYGENDEGEVMMGSEPGLASAIAAIIKDIIELKPNPPYILYSMPVKFILNDEYRNNTINFEKKRLEDIDISSYVRKDYYKWHEESRPCPTCKLNKKDHWSDMHYNCEEGYTMSCFILKEWMDEVRKRAEVDTLKIEKLTEQERQEILKKCRPEKKFKSIENKDIEYDPKIKINDI